MNLKKIHTLSLFAALSGFLLTGLQAQMPDLKSMTDSVTQKPETDDKTSDLLAGILGAIDQGAEAYPEQTSAIAEQLKAMTGGKVPSKDSLMNLASAVQSVWSAGDFTAADAETMASTLNSVLNSANIPLPAWTGSLKSIQDLLEQSGVTTEKALDFGMQLKDYVLALTN